MSNDFDLESLREVWQKQTKGHVYSQNDIFEMIRKKSITSVKWIFYISLVEITLSLFAYIYLIMHDGFEAYHKQLSFSFGKGAYVIESMEIFSVLINVYFLHLFFNAYKNIHAELTVRALTKSIINFKSVVTKFIYFNIGLGLLAMLFVVIMVGNNSQFELSTKESSILIGVTLITFIIILALVSLYYYFLYGTFIRRLKKNLKSLSEIKEA